METPTPSPTSSTRRTAILLVAVAFVAGALIGFAGGRVYSIYRLFNRRGPELFMHGILGHLDRELKLTPQQHDQIAAIMDRHHKRMQALADGIRPQMHQELDAANKEIGAVLTPEQRKKFDEMQMRMQRFRPGRGRRHEGPPPPGT
jgi:Spy/CpxP family protein refolding chaperone